ncbi:MAG: glucokinase [Sedimenticolaceae bacterium]
MRFLAADIGGTYSRLSWSTDGSDVGNEPQVFNNAEFDSLEAVIERGLEMLAARGQPIEHMVLAVAGPTHTDPIQLTNIDWKLDRNRLQARLQVSRLTIVNDFQAAALGAIAEPRERLKVLNAAPPDDGAVVVAGAGTGLGMAWLPTADTRVLPRATEGGHLDFGPNNERETALYRWLAARYGHVSYERILSGDGLLDTYDFLSGNNVQATEPAQIAALARQADTHAADAVRLFVGIFAAYAGNLALAFNPGGGIYLCGGLTVHLADWFEPTSFLATFSAKGRMAGVVSRIPVFLVTRHDTGLSGARHIARNFNRADT